MHPHIFYSHGKMCDERNENKYYTCKHKFTKGIDGINEYEMYVKYVVFT